MSSAAKIRTVRRDKPVAADYWPEPLRPYAIEANKLRFRQAVAIPGQYWLTAYAVLLCGIAIIAAFYAAVALTVGFALVGAGLLALVGSDFFRWYSIERTTSGWLIERRIWRRVIRRDAIDDHKVLTALMVRDVRSYGAGAYPPRFHLQIEFRSIPFAGAPPAVPIGEGLGVPVEELELLRRLLLRRGSRTQPNRRAVDNGGRRSPMKQQQLFERLATDMQRRHLAIWFLSSVLVGFMTYRLIAVLVG